MKNTEDWFRLLSDEDRAAVMKTQITETELTKRTLAEEREKTVREQSSSENYQVVRGLALFALVIIAGCCTCGGYRCVEAWEAVQLGHTKAIPDAGG